MCLRVKDSGSEPAGTLHLVVGQVLCARPFSLPVASCRAVSCRVVYFLLLVWPCLVGHQPLVIPIQSNSLPDVRLHRWHGMASHVMAWRGWRPPLSFGMPGNWLNVPGRD